MPESRNGSWVDRCPRTVSGYPSSRASRTSGRTETAGRSRGVDVRKGKLLAGDSGRKIAEVIDLRGAIYQRGSREESGGTNASACVRALSCTCKDTPCPCAEDKWKG